jgi:ABC-2 type transport system permease protein
MSGLLRSEWRKLMAGRAWWALLLALLAVVILVAVGTTRLINANSFGQFQAPTRSLDVDALVQISVQTFVGAALFPLLLGVLVAAGERRHGMAAVTGLAAPQRALVVLAKAVVVAAVGALYGVVAVVVANAAIAVTAGLEGAEGALPLTDPVLLRGAAGAVVAFALWGVIGVGVGAAVGDTTLAVIGSLLWTRVAESAVGLSLSNSGYRAPVVSYLPVTATASLSIALDGARTLVGSVSQSTAVLVLALWAAAFLVLGMVLASRRDLA